MEYLDGPLCLGNEMTVEGFEELALAAILSHPNKNLCAEIQREGSNYAFHTLPSITPSSQAIPSSTSTRVGHLFSRNMRNMSDFDFERPLQPSLFEFRSMYESGDTLRAFFATNGVGWAFRMFDFQNVSIAELNWLEYNIIKAMRGKNGIDVFLASLPKRMALGLLQRDRAMVENLVKELEAMVSGIERLQDQYGALPVQKITEVRSRAASVIVAGEAFLQMGKSESLQIFEQHLVEAFKAIRQGDSMLAFNEVMKFALPVISSLADAGDGGNRIRRIVEVSHRLRELKIPDTQEAIRLSAILDFFLKINDSGYSFLREGYDKRKKSSDDWNNSRGQMRTIVGSSMSDQFASAAETFDGVEEFMVEAIRRYPNKVVGEVRKAAKRPNQYAIENLRVVPCDVEVKLFSVMRSPKARSEENGAVDSNMAVGRAISKACCCLGEMLCSLHPRTRSLNEMLDSGYVFNAVALTDGKKCVFRLHDGSDNTVLAAYLPSGFNDMRGTPDSS